MKPRPPAGRLEGSLLLLGILLAGCIDPPPTSSDGTPLQVIAGSGPSTTRSDPAEILQASLDGDELRLQLRFGGGCEEHAFALLHRGEFMESYPVQTNLTLAHDARGDMCRALLTREETFDLTPVKRAYQEAYGQHGVMVIHIRPPGPEPGSAHSVRYEF